MNTALPLLQVERASVRYTLRRAGLLAPARTPKPVIDRLHGETVKILAGPTRQRLEAQGFEPDGGTPTAFAAYIKSEIAKWAKVIKQAGIPAE